MKRDFTFDTGMLIAISRRKSRALDRLREMERASRSITIPIVIIAEFWRGRTDQAERTLRIRGAVMEPLTTVVAKLAGEAIAQLGSDKKVHAGLTIDAIVMASASLRGDTVLTSDVHDLERLRAFFTNVAVLPI
jgi:predicted nucleic acid-binding protein